MNSMRNSLPGPAALRAGIATVLIAVLAACSGTPRPKPVPLPANVALMGVKQAWSIKLPTVSFPLATGVSGDLIALGSGDGTVVLFDARAGKEIWRASAGAPLAAGVGSDGSLVAVVTTNGELVAMEGGKVLWKQRLTAQAYTPPLVAGRRIFVQAADRTTSAWDGQSGRRLWSQQRAAENLVLKKPGVLLAVGDTLIAGVGGRMVGINPANGSSRWEAPIASPRGTNDIERLVDLVGTVSRVRDNLCARAYFASVGCVDTTRGTLVWTKPAIGADGLGGDERLVYGAEDSGAVVAWRRSDGEVAWQQPDLLKYHELTAPLAVGRALIIGDATGLVHVLSSADGSPLNRLTPDGSPIAATPVLAGNTVVVVTRNGGVFGYRPE
jgi:outer membrane protein assembly factor BamB